MYLRPLYLATETRESIASFIIEDLTRLAEGTESSVHDLWLKIDAFMSDSVSKNWHVADMVAEMLQSDHVPLMLFCNAHLTLKMDEGHVKVLSKMEET